MQIKDVVNALEDYAYPSLQEAYDNAGLLAGSAQWECSGVLVTLDCTEAIVKEAIEKNCNLIVAHHPIIFKGLKKITGKTYIEQTIITAIKNDIAIYAIHTNLDNIITGVNGKIADKLGLVNRKILAPKTSLLRKLSVYVPLANKDVLLEALFSAGAGNIGNYSECSFSTAGNGTYTPNEAARPYLGEPGKRHTEEEARIEVVFPQWMQGKIIEAMIQNHPYEEVAHDIYVLENAYLQTGSGLTGNLPVGVTEMAFLQLLQETFKVPCIKHTAFTGKMIADVAICGGAGSFLTPNAIASGADAYVTADLKYHEFFDAEGKLLLADIGHYESEQYTQDLLFDFLREKFLNFAVLKTGVNTNPVHYYPLQSS